MLVRVVKEFKYRTGVKDFKIVNPGDIVNIENRHDLNALLASNYITLIQNPYSTSSAPVAQSFAKVKRVGIWTTAPRHYSGGRILMFQLAWNLADNGCEVFLVADKNHIWSKDYPAISNVYYVNNSKIPKDLDVIMTDNRGGSGRDAFNRWKAMNKTVPFLYMNFESSNWVREYCPTTADRFNDVAWKDMIEVATYLIPCSRLSGEYLVKWIGAEREYHVLPPAINNFALEESKRFDTGSFPKRPYVVWISRNSLYKGSKTLIDSCLSIDIPFDIMLFGSPPDVKNNKFHTFLNYYCQPDVIKYAALRNAHIVLAPSTFEGFGMVPMESLAAGTACVVYDLPVLREVYGDRLIYVPWDDKKAFRNKIEEVMSKPKIEVKNEQKWVLNTYSMRNMAENVDNLPFLHMKKTRVTAHMICLWGDTVQEALESVYPYVDEINIAYGATEINPTDYNEDALAKIQAFNDIDKKIKLEVRKIWRSKEEMRTWCSKYAHGNYMLILDADEIWTGMEEWLSNPVSFGSPRWVNFWHSRNYWIHGPDNTHVRFGARLQPYGSECNHYRWSWWRPSYWWKHHAVPYDMDTQMLMGDKNSNYDLKSKPETIIYHLGHCLSDSTMKAKHNFYIKRDGGPCIGRKAFWEKWNGELGNYGGNVIEKVTWPIPDIVLRALDKCRIESEKLNDSIILTGTK